MPMSCTLQTRLKWSILIGTFITIFKNVTNGYFWVMSPWMMIMFFLSLSLVYKFQIINKVTFKKWRINLALKQKKTLPHHFKDSMKLVHIITPNKQEARISRRRSETLNVECRGGNHSEPLVAQTVLSAHTAPQSGQTITGGSNSGKRKSFHLFALG